MSGDIDLEIIKRRMLQRMQKELLGKKDAKKAEPDYYAVFLEHLTEDGKMMFEKAVEQYGDTARKIGEKLGRLYYSGRLKGDMNAETVYWVFSEIGLPIRLETKIVYKKGGEVKSISDMLKEE
ncbi:hypothetical protein [Infirmifilum sp. SLHALR2]